MSIDLMDDISRSDQTSAYAHTVTTANEECGSPTLTHCILCS